MLLYSEVVKTRTQFILMKIPICYAYSEAIALRTFIFVRTLKKNALKSN